MEGLAGHCKHFGMYLEYGGKPLICLTILLSLAAVLRLDCRRLSRVEADTYKKAVAVT